MKFLTVIGQNLSIVFANLNQSKISSHQKFCHWKKGQKKKVIWYKNIRKNDTSKFGLVYSCFILFCFLLCYTFIIGIISSFSPVFHFNFLFSFLRGGNPELNLKDSGRSRHMDEFSDNRRPSRALKLKNLLSYVHFFNVRCVGNLNL